MRAAAIFNSEEHKELLILKFKQAGQTLSVPVYYQAVGEENCGFNSVSQTAATGQSQRQLLDVH